MCVAARSDRVVVILFSPREHIGKVTRERAIGELAQAAALGRLDVRAVGVSAQTDLRTSIEIDVRDRRPRRWNAFVELIFKTSEVRIDGRAQKRQVDTSE